MGLEVGGKVAGQENGDSPRIVDGLVCFSRNTGGDVQELGDNIHCFCVGFKRGTSGEEPAYSLRNRWGWFDQDLS